MFDIGYHIDTVGGAKFIINVCGIQCANWQIPIAKKGDKKNSVRIL